MRLQFVRVPMVMAMFAVGAIYASFCATQCALDAWPGCNQQAQNQPDSPSHSEDSHHDGSGDSACPASGHLDAYVPATAGIAPALSEAVGPMSMPAALVVGLEAVSVIPSTLRASDLAPPYGVNSSLYQQTSVLRI